MEKRKRIPNWAWGLAILLAIAAISFTVGRAAVYKLTLAYLIVYWIVILFGIVVLANSLSHLRRIEWAWVLAIFLAIAAISFTVGRTPSGSAIPEIKWEFNPVLWLPYSSPVSPYLGTMPWDGFGSSEEIKWTAFGFTLAYWVVISLALVAFAKSLTRLIHKIRDSKTA